MWERSRIALAAGDVVMLAMHINGDCPGINHVSCSCHFMKLNITCSRHCITQQQQNTWKMDDSSQSHWYIFQDFTRIALWNMFPFPVPPADSKRKVAIGMTSSLSACMLLRVSDVGARPCIPQKARPMMLWYPIESLGKFSPKVDVTANGNDESSHPETSRARSTLSKWNNSSSSKIACGKP